MFSPGNVPTLTTQFDSDLASPGTRPQSWQDLEETWEKVLDVYEGLYQEEVRKEYLVARKGERDDDYSDRLNIAYLDNHFRKTIRTTAGLLRRWTLKDETHPTIVDNQKNIDLRGHTLQRVLMRADIKALRDDCMLLGVDYPQTIGPDGEIQTSEQDRPRIFCVDIRDVFDPLVEVIDGIEVMTRVSIRRVRQVRVGKEGWDQSIEYWVYEPGTLKVYKQVSGVQGSQLYTPTGNVIPRKFVESRPIPILKADGTPMDRIPFVWYQVDIDSDLLDPKVPPFNTLCDLAIAYMNKENELDQVETQCNRPTPKQSWPGKVPAKPPKIRLGPNAVWHYVAGSEVGYAEPAGTAISMTADRQEKRLERMRQEEERFLGLNTPMTATQAILEDAQMSANLETTAEAKETAVAELFRIWNMFIDPNYDGISDAGGIEIDRSVVESKPTPQEVLAISQEFGAGLLTRTEAIAKQIEIGAWPSDESLERAREIAVASQGQLAAEQSARENPSLEG